MNRIVVMLLMPMLLAAGAAAAETPSNPPEPTRQSRPDRGGRAYWRIFSEMSPEERKAMRELQERDPEAYERAMKEKVEAQTARDREREEKVRKLVTTCRTSDDPAARDAARAELTAFIREGYMHRLRDNERYVEELKRRAERLEQNLEEKRRNADQEIARAVQMLLEGKFPPPRKDAPEPPFGNRPAPPEAE